MKNLFAPIGLALLLSLNGIAFSADEEPAATEETKAEESTSESTEAPMPADAPAEESASEETTK